MFGDFWVGGCEIGGEECLGGGLCRGGYEGGAELGGGGLEEGVSVAAGEVGCVWVFGGVVWMGVRGCGCG